MKALRFLVKQHPKAEIKTVKKLFNFIFQLCRLNWLHREILLIVLCPFINSESRLLPLKFKECLKMRIWVRKVVDGEFYVGVGVKGLLVFIEFSY